MREYVDVTGVRVVRVAGSDGEVVDGLFPVVVVDRGDLHPGARTGLEPVAGLEVSGVNPLLLVRGPEGVAFGGGDGPAVTVRTGYLEGDEVFVALAGDRGDDGAVGVLPAGELQTES